MGLLGVDSNSAKQTQVSATDYAKALSGKNTYLESGSLNLAGKGAKYQETGSTDISVGKGGTLKTATDLAGSVIQGNVTIGDSATLATAFSSALDKVGEIASQSTGAATAALDKVAQQETGQVSWYREPILWLGVGAVALVWLVGKIFSRK